MDSNYIKIVNLLFLYFTIFFWGGDHAFIFNLSFVNQYICFAQHIERINLSKKVSIDGIHIQKSGNLLFTEGWDGNDIFKITPDGTVSVFSTGLKGPIDILQGLDGYYYVSLWKGKGIAQISQNGKILKTIPTKPGPGPMVIDKKGTIYITHNINDGSGFITAIDISGNPTIYASGQMLKNPGGIDMDDQGNLIIANFNDGHIIKIDNNKKQTHFSSIPVKGKWKTGHLKVNKNKIYVTSISSDRIYMIDQLGKASIFVQQGSPKKIKIANPNGLTISPDKTFLYFTNSFGPTNFFQRLKIK